MNISEIRSFVAKNTGSLTVDDNGNIVKAKLGERFRMFFNIGGARDESNRRVLSALKNAILDQVEFFRCDETAIREFDTLQNRFALRGKDLSALFTRIDAIRSQTQTLEQLTIERLATMSDHPVCRAFAKYGHLSELQTIAAKFTEAAYREAVGNSQKQTFVVGTTMSAFLSHCQEILDEAENGDPKLTEMMVSNFFKLTVRGDARLRSSDDVVDNLKACRRFIQDARDLAKRENRPYIADIAISYVNRLGGAGKMGEGEMEKFRELFPGESPNGKYDLNVAILKKYVIDATERLVPELKAELKMALVENDSTSAVDRLVFALTRKLMDQEVFQCSMLSGGPENEQCMGYHQARTFAALLSPEERQALKTFFASPKAKNLCNFYMESAFGGNWSKVRLDQITQPMMQHVFAGLRDGVLGRVVPPPKNGELNEVDYSQLPSSVTCRLCPTKTIISKEGYVPAMGRYDDAVRSPFFLERTRNYGAGLLNSHLARSMARGENAVLKDFRNAVRNRSLTVRLTDGSLLPDDPDKACDALAALIRGDRSARFGDLEKKDRTRALLMMSLLTKELVGFAHRSVTTFFDPERKRSMMVSGDGTQSESQQAGIPPTVVLAYDARGGISLHMTSQLPISRYTVEDRLSWYSERETFDVGRGSNVRTSMDVMIDAEEADRLADLDWSRCDVGQVEQEFGSGDHGKNWLERLTAKLPQEFQIKMEVMPTYSLYISHQKYQEGATYPSHWKPVEDI